MSEIIGIMFIFTAIVIFCTFMVCWDMTLKEKIQTIMLCEIVIGLVVFGSYLVGQ